MFPSGLFPKALFPPTVFPRLGAVVVPVRLPGARYWAPRYFAGVYFPPTYFGPYPPSFGVPGKPTPLGGYWPHGYFAGAYFAPTYWCPWACPDDLLGAIHRRVDADPVLRSLLGDRHWTGEAAPDPGRPYLVLDEISSVVVNRNTGLDWTEDRQLQANFFAEGTDQAAQFLDAWEAAFFPTMDPLCIADGYVKGCLVTGDHLAPLDAVAPPSTASATASRVRQLVVEFTAMVGRQGAGVGG